MLILIFIDVQYIQNVVFSFQKGSNGLNDSSLDFYHPSKKIPPAKFFVSFGEFLPYPLTLFVKP